MTLYALNFVAIADWPAGGSEKIIKNFLSVSNYGKIDGLSCRWACDVECAALVEKESTHQGVGRDVEGDVQLPD